ncbi:MAG: diacylglycerol kinase [Candidatus Omnitrophica bacterium]|nr:diacylglycerol kinase [Candidatus Omnitrophota bacterium]
MGITKQRDLLSSFNSAFRGLLYILKIERNFRLHFLVGTGVVLGSLFLNLTLGEFLGILLVVMAVMVAEVFNTVIEHLTDTLFQQFSIQAKRIKDMSAAAVLLTAVTAVIAGYLITAKYFPPGWRFAFKNIAGSPWYVTFVGLVVVCTLSLILKFILKRDSLLSGGMPSLHSGISFSIWTIVSFLTFHQQPLISLLVLWLAIWVAQSRIERRIHKLEEVIIGALVGILITVLTIQVFWGLLSWKI